MKDGKTIFVSNSSHLSVAVSSEICNVRRSQNKRALRPLSPFFFFFLAQRSGAVFLPEKLMVEDARGMKHKVCDPRCFIISSFRPKKLQGDQGG